MPINPHRAIFSTVSRGNLSSSSTSAASGSTSFSANALNVLRLISCSFVSLKSMYALLSLFPYIYGPPGCGGLLRQVMI